MVRLPSQKVAIAAAVKTLHGKRRAAGLCIYDAREFGRPEHGPPHRGGRCDACWKAKLESQERSRAEERKQKQRSRATAGGLGSARMKGAA